MNSFLAFPLFAVPIRVKGKIKQHTVSFFEDILVLRFVAVFHYVVSSHLFSLSSSFSLNLFFFV